MGNFENDGVMPERCDDLHADRPSVGMRLAGNADAGQSGGVHPGAKHALCRGCKTRRRVVLGPPGSERIKRINIGGGRYRKSAFGGSANVLACLGAPAIREPDHDARAAAAAVSTA